VTISDFGLTEVTKVAPGSSAIEPLGLEDEEDGSIYGLYGFYGVVPRRDLRIGTETLPRPETWQKAVPFLRDGEEIYGLYGFYGALEDESLLLDLGEARPPRIFERKFAELSFAAEEDAFYGLYGFYSALAASPLTVPVSVGLARYSGFTEPDIIRADSSYGFYGLYGMDESYAANDPTEEEWTEDILEEILDRPMEPRLVTDIVDYATRHPIPNPESFYGFYGFYGELPGDWTEFESLRTNSHEIFPTLERMDPPGSGFEVVSYKMEGGDPYERFYGFYGFYGAVEEGEEVPFDEVGTTWELEQEPLDEWAGLQPHHEQVRWSRVKLPIDNIH
jgi:hypothetical protein